MGSSPVGQLRLLDSSIFWEDAFQITFGTVSKDKVRDRALRYKLVFSYNQTFWKWRVDRLGWVSEFVNGWFDPA